MIEASDRFDGVKCQQGWEVVTKGQESNHLKRSKVKYVCIQMIDTEFDFYLYFFFLEIQCVCIPVK